MKLYVYCALRIFNIKDRESSYQEDAKKPQPQPAALLYPHRLLSNFGEKIGSATEQREEEKMAVVQKRNKR